MREPSADPRQRLSERQVDDALPADRGMHADEPSTIFHDGSDPRRALAQRMPAHRAENGFGSVLRNEGDQFSLVRDEHRIEAEDLACAADGVADRNARFVDLHAHFLRDAISTSDAATPPRAAITFSTCNAYRRPAASSVTQPHSRVVTMSGSFGGRHSPLLQKQQRECQ